ncbi:MAG: endonuclease/exonuclease/phosphatase family protein [Chloroflexia bacterium]|nr:endonuclease/exonuclease/phosphatase family protein [Chloroflexia bacterium]
MDVSVGTFNLNNLFSRYSFRAEAATGNDPALTVSVTYSFADPSAYRVRTFGGRLVDAKPAEERETIARRIRAMDADVLAVQEVEDIDTLRFFAAEELRGMYPYQVLIEGNDPRLIDLGLLSRLPIGAVTSWQQAVHPEVPEVPVFSRDMLEVEILNQGRTRRLFTLYNNHLKSRFIPLGQDPAVGTRRADTKRRRQAETVARIVSARTRPSSRYVVLGDLNDPPESPCLAPLLTASELGLVNGLANPEETRTARPDSPAPTTTAWTHRYKPVGQPAQYHLFDQIWLSPALAQRQTGAWIDRRTKHSGDGSDHDPAWVSLRL